jgi:hypothetical protein
VTGNSLRGFFSSLQKKEIKKTYKRLGGKKLEVFMTCTCVERGRNVTPGWFRQILVSPCEKHPA